MSDGNCFPDDEDFKLRVHIEADDPEPVSHDPSFTYGFPDDVKKDGQPEADDGITRISAGASAPHPLVQIRQDLERLALAFDTKIKYDAHKEKIIDDLHQELQQYREGLLKKYLHRIIVDVIKIVDDMRKFSDHHRNQPLIPETADKALAFIHNVAGDLEELFAWEGLTPFADEGDAFDSTRQRIVNKIETDSPDLDKKVAKHVRPGYEWEGKVIRPELVSVFIFNPENGEKDNNS